MLKNIQFYLQSHLALSMEGWRSRGGQQAIIENEFATINHYKCPLLRQFLTYKSGKICMKVVQNLLYIYKISGDFPSR